MPASPSSPSSSSSSSPPSVGPSAIVPTATSADTPSPDVARDEAPRGPSREPSVRPPKHLLRGDVVGRYVVLDKVGAGGMGIVYAAYDPELDRKIALKLIRPGVRGRAEVARARLLREAQALARLSHPAVIAVHDVGTFEDQVFVAMEFVDGIDVSKWLRKRRSWREVLPVMRQAGEGLAAAHAAGVIHRDFKPENVLISSTASGGNASSGVGAAMAPPHEQLDAPVFDRVRVLDFGLARTDASEATIERTSDGEPVERAALARATGSIAPVPMPDRVGVSSERGPAAANPRLTQAGAVMGTPAYMAPEQHTGGEIDARSDQFAYCVATYEALYGERPFAGETAPEIAYHVVRGRVRDAPRDGPPVPAWIRKVLLRGLAVEPRDRWPDMRALLTALAADPAARQRKLALATLGLGALAAAGLVLSALVEPDDTVCRGAERKLDDVWDPTVRGEIEAAFGKSERPYAGDAFASTAAQLDDYATRFVAAHTDACEATALRKEQSQELLDRRMACLEGRLKDVRALTRLLRHADDDAVTQAVAAASALPSLDPCSDREALIEGAPPLPPEDAARVAEVEDMLAAGRQELRLADYEDSLATARSALTAARESGHAPVVAAALLLLGRAELQMGENEAAERSLYEAVWAADEAKDDRLRAEAWKDLVWIAGLAHGREQDALRLAESATHALERAGGDPLIEAELHNNLGVNALRRGDTTTAIAEHSSALELRREHIPSADPRTADSLLNLGNSLADAGRFDEAEAALVEGEDIVRKRLGEAHPRFAKALHARGIMKFRRGDYGSAADLLTRATAIRELALSREHPDRAASLHDLGVVLLKAHRAAEARDRFAAAVELRESTLPAGDLAIANSLTGLGQAELELGQVAAATEVLARALVMREAVGGDPIDAAETRFAYAQALWHTAPGRARKLADAALAAYRTTAEHATEATEIGAWLRDHPAG